MSNIYVPIDKTDVKSVIPSGEEIIYSTMMSSIIKIDRYIGNDMVADGQRAGFRWSGQL